jgi:hypothetical protein
MTRSLSGTVATASVAEVVKRTVAVELDFDSGILYACGAPFNIVIGGHTYIGLGQLGSITAVEESADVQASSLTLTLTGIPRTYVSTAMTENYQNRAAIISEVLLDISTEAVLASPVVLFKGRMDTMTVALDATIATVSVSCTNRLANWERPKNAMYSDEEQRRRYPGDLGLQYAAAMATRSVKLPTVVF